LTYERGFLINAQNPNDNFLSILRVVGNPSQPQGRMLSLNTHVTEDRLHVYIMAYAEDGSGPITVTEIFGNNAVIASCRTTSPQDAGKCIYEWPVTSMLPGNNELRMEYERDRAPSDPVGTTAKVRFQTYGRVGRP
jgi:hypothetical protein